MGPLLAFVVACSAGTPTGVDTAANSDDAPLVVNPRSLVLEANQVSVFKAYASGVAGDSLVTSIEWTATGGSIGLDGTYSAPSTGDYRVVGKRHTHTKTTTDSAIVVVVPPQPTLMGVVIAPGSATVAAGKQQTFNAVGRLTDSTSAAIGVIWTATGGYIDAGGVFTAGSSPGTYRIIAKAATAGVADTVPVVITPAPVAPPPPPPPPPPGSPPPTGSFPSLPSGYNVPAGYVDDFNSSSGTEGIFTPMYSIGIKNAATYSPLGVAAPRNPPSSPNGIGEASFPGGFSSGGIAPGIVWSKDITSNGWSGLYISFTVQLSSNWVSHSSAINKVVIANIDNQPMLVLLAYGANKWVAGVQDIEADPKGGARQLYPNLAGGDVTKGLWQRVEVQAIANTPGQANGTVRIWLTNFDSNGNRVSGPTKVTEYNDVGWVASGHPTSWNKVSWNPIWGGTGGPTVPVQQYMWMDQLAVGGH